MLYKEAVLARVPAEVLWSSSGPQAGAAAIPRLPPEEAPGHPHATHAGVVEQVALLEALPWEATKTQSPGEVEHPAEAVEAVPSSAGPASALATARLRRVSAKVAPTTQNASARLPETGADASASVLMEPPP